MTGRADYALDTNVDMKFTTRAFATGIPTTLAGAPVVAFFPNNSTLATTLGVTLTTDFAGVTGNNHVRVAAFSGNGFASGSSYIGVITSGSVAGATVRGETVCEFSINAQAPLRPTVAARTLDVTATGAAGIDWANVENPTTALNLSATNIDVDQVVASVVGDIGGLAPNAITDTAEAVWNAVETLYDAAGSMGELLHNASSAGDPWATAIPGAYGAGTAGFIVGTNLNATITSRMATFSLPTNFAALAITAGGGVTVATNGDKTGYTLSSAGITAVLGQAITEAYPTAGAQLTLASFAYAVTQYLTEFSITAGVYTVLQRDQATPAMTFGLNSTTQPTAVTQT